MCTWTVQLMDIHIRWEQAIPSRVSLLQFFGKSGKCCPECFYSPEGDWFVDEQFHSSDKPIMAENLIRKNMEFCEPYDKDPARYDRIKSFLRDKKTRVCMASFQRFWI